IHFSSTPLRGLIYYTEYQRGASNPLPSPPVGGVCKPGTGTAVIRALDPTQKIAPVNPFETVAPGGCPVCHSVSANGRMFVTSHRSEGRGGAFPSINPAGTSPPPAAAPPSPTPGTDSRGFAWSTLTPDGQYALQGSNIWGNTIWTGSTGTGYRISQGNGRGL